MKLSVSLIGCEFESLYSHIFCYFIFLLIQWYQYITDTKITDTIVSVISDIFIIKTEKQHMYNFIDTFWPSVTNLVSVKPIFLIVNLTRVKCFCCLFIGQ